MIDTHCHLEQSDYDMDRDDVIKRCKKHLQAIITSCANPKHFDLTLRLLKKHDRFVYSTVSVHPKYVKDLKDNEIREYFNLIKSNRDSFVAIGETGLDYYWIKEAEWREKQKSIFKLLITLAEQIRLPLVIHSRDSTEEVIEILEQESAKHVQMHMFTDRSFLNNVIENGWLISVNTLLLRSKNVRKIVRDCPLENLMLETDAPWLGIGDDGEIKQKEKVRNDPTSVRLIAEKISEVKKVGIEEVDCRTTKNAVEFFKLKI